MKLYRLQTLKCGIFTANACRTGKLASLHNSPGWDTWQRAIKALGEYAEKMSDFVFFFREEFIKAPYITCEFERILERNDIAELVEIEIPDQYVFIVDDVQAVVPWSLLDEDVIHARVWETNVRKTPLAFSHRHLSLPLSFS